LFTATSATCVTGLILVDTAIHWSLFGQIVILVLIQVGGLGFISIGTAFASIARRRIGLRRRGMLRESLNVLDMGSVYQLVALALKGTLLFEGVGALLLAIRFVPRYGFLSGIYYGIFHSVSAFCNAGFDLFARHGISSFTEFRSDPLVMLTICALILIGGVGFLIWEDLRDHRFRFRKYTLQTKIVLTFSAVLVFGGAVLFYLLEQQHTFAGMAPGEKILSSLFCSITPRTAGFNVIEYGEMSEPGKLLTIIFMFIGGGSGSTAGGLKMTTVFVLLLHLKSTLNRSSGNNAFGRRISQSIVAKATALTMTYILMAFTSTLLISGTQGFPVTETMFEVVSAICTVGVSTGLTRHLGLLSQFVIIVLMYTGRLNSLSFALSFTDHKRTARVTLPEENVNIG
jgi:trk system potassium uptake protein TrkH